MPCLSTSAAGLRGCVGATARIHAGFHRCSRASSNIMAAEALSPSLHSAANGKER